MPKIIDGKALTRHEHEIWKAAFDNSKDGAIATAAVQKYRSGREDKTTTKKTKK